MYFYIIFAPYKNSIAVIHPHPKGTAMTKTDYNMADSELYITNAAYHADTTRISKSGLDLIARSPAHYFHKYLSAERPAEKRTPALIQGGAIHTAVLEPHLFAGQYAIEPEVNKRTNKGKEDIELFVAANQGKTIIDLDTYTMAMRMRDAVYKHPVASELLNAGTAEQTIVWNDEDTGARCKCRPDFVTASGIILDLKSTEDASSEAFGKSSFNYRYHVQAPFYSDGVEANGRSFEGFAFIAVEKTPPYAVVIYYVDDRIMSLGRQAYKKDLERYVMCLEKNQWPAYGDDVQPLSLPAWAFK